jgi:hypothetical protein
MLGKMVADRGELEHFGRGFNSSIAFWIMMRFAQECAHSRKTGFPVTQSFTTAYKAPLRLLGIAGE